MEALGILAIVGAAALSAATSRAWRARFRRAARAASLEPAPWESRATGRLRGFPVTVHVEGVDGHWLTVIAVGGLPSDVSVLADRRGPRPGDLTIGEARFDGAFRVRGDERRVRGALSASARSFALHLAGEVAGFRLKGGRLELRLPGYLAEARVLRAQLRAALSLVEAMFRGASPTDRLYANAFDDPSPGVREHNLRVLLDQVDGPRRLEAIARALDHRQPELRLLAARAAGSGAWPVLAELGRSPLLDPALRRRAILALPASTPRAIRVAVALSALGKPDTALAGAAARLAGRSAEPGQARVEEALLALLARDDDASRAAAISALGRVGTARAVVRLLPFTEGILTPAPLKARARAAVRAIQGRLTHGEVGAISLAAGGGPTGLLSLVD